MAEVDHSIEASQARMAARGTAFVAELSPALNDREDTLPQRVMTEKGSAKAKLHRIYRLIDEFAAIRAPHVACRSGCADCCRMNVQISGVEAAYIEQTTGVRAAKLTAPGVHSLSEFNGMPCPFLRENACTIYAARPSSCRLHASFDMDAHWCAPSRSTAIEVRMVKLGGAILAVAALTELQGAPFVDIRDFFPARANGRSFHGVSPDAVPYRLETQRKRESYEATC